MHYLRYILIVSLLTCSSLTLAQVVEKTVTTTTTIAPDTSETKAAPISTAVESASGAATIITPVPSAKEVISTPEGFVHCFTVEAGWYKKMWVPAHKICQYQNVPGQKITYEGVAWVEGYWSCTDYTGATCTKWEWRKGHWVKTLEVY